MRVRGLYPSDGDASNITKALAGSPDTLAALAPFLSQVMNATTVDLATKELVVQTRAERPRGMARWRRRRDHRRRRRIA